MNDSTFILTRICVFTNINTKVEVEASPASFSKYKCELQMTDRCDLFALSTRVSAQEQI